MSKKQINAFSLLELLVVISIMGLLIAMGAVAFATVQQRGRDAKRRADMQGIQKAFEQYNAVNSSYEACSTMATSEYLPAGLPTDPQPSKSYVIGASNCDADGYCICAELEGDGTGNADAPTDTSCNFNSTDGNYFCVTNLQ